MKRYRIRIGPAAAEDMERLYRYTAVDLHEPETAARLLRRVKAAVEGLEQFPERYRVSEFSVGCGEKLRRMLVGNWSVFYLVREDEVYVTAVLYSASDLHAHLRDRSEGKW